MAELRKRALLWALAGMVLAPLLVVSVGLLISRQNDRWDDEVTDLILTGIAVCAGIVYLFRLPISIGEKVILTLFYIPFSIVFLIMYALFFLEVFFNKYL